MQEVLKINEDIKELNYKLIYNNLFFYDYNLKFLKKLYKQKIDYDNPQYTSTISSLKGEVYENIIYELLLRYAKENEIITKFVLKGPHQNKQISNGKNGFLIDGHSQIVYKSRYKDISEFDGLFFTKDSIYFIESTIVNTTLSLRRRLRKKKALLEVLYPHIKIKALIILTKGATGINVFPDFCDVWVTNDFDIEPILEDIIKTKKENIEFQSIKDRKFIQTYHLKYAKFQYFLTLQYMLKNTNKGDQKIDFQFLTTVKSRRYINIFTKAYLGYITLDEFKKIVPSFDENIEDDTLYVAMEQKDNGVFCLVYFAKFVNDKLKRLEYNETLSIADKDYKGFTNAEIKYLKYIFNDRYALKHTMIEEILSNISKIKPTDY